MSGDELEPDSEDTEVGESGASEPGESTPEEAQPEIDPDEQADIGDLADLAEQVEAEAGATDDETDTTEQDPADELPTRDASINDSWGDLYVGTVTTGLNAVIDEYGKEDASHIDESLARDLNLDVYVDKWMAENDRAEMDPGTGMMVATATLCATVLMTKTELPSKALERGKAA